MGVWEEEEEEGRREPSSGVAVGAGVVCVHRAPAPRENSAFPGEKDG